MKVSTKGLIFWVNMELKKEARVYPNGNSFRNYYSFDTDSHEIGSDDAYHY